MHPAFLPGIFSIDEHSHKFVPAKARLYLICFKKWNRLARHLHLRKKLIFQFKTGSGPGVGHQLCFWIQSPWALERYECLKIKEFHIHGTKNDPFALIFQEKGGRMRKLSRKPT